MKILALLDDRPGNNNQTLAIAEKLGNYISLKIEFNALSKLPNCFLGKSTPGIKTKLPDDYDIIIAAGRKLARVSAIIKQRNPNCRNIQIMLPQMPYNNFDLIFAPEHDKPAKAQNIKQIIGSINRIDAEFLQNQKNKFTNGINVALIGDIKNNDEVKKLAQIKNLHISTSRRTKPATIAALYALNPAYIYDWRAQGDNPYYSLLKASENIIVSADSCGMISEACSAGKKVFIFAKPHKKKFESFIEKLFQQNFAYPISQFSEISEKKIQAKKLSTRDEVIRKISDNFGIEL